MLFIWNVIITYQHIFFITRCLFFHGNGLEKPLKINDFLPPQDAGHVRGQRRRPERVEQLGRGRVSPSPIRKTTEVCEMRTSVFIVFCRDKGCLKPRNQE